MLSSLQRRASRTFLPPVQEELLSPSLPAPGSGHTSTCVTLSGSFFFPSWSPTLSHELPSAGLQGDTVTDGVWDCGSVRKTPAPPQPARTGGGVREGSRDLPISPTPHRRLLPVGPANSLWSSQFCSMSRCPPNLELVCDGDWGSGGRHGGTKSHPRPRPKRSPLCAPGPVGSRADQEFLGRAGPVKMPLGCLRGSEVHLEVRLEYQ